MAICASFLVHAVLAWGVATLRPQAEPPPQSAMIVQLVAAFPAPPAPADPGPEGGGAPSRPRSRPAAPRAVPPEPAPPRAAPVMAVPAPAPPSTARPAVAAAPASPPEDLLADYRRRLWAHLAAHAPPAPRGSGTVSVVFGVDAHGGLLFVRLGRSSGRPAFDRAGLASVRAAAPLPAPPEGVDPADLVFTVPIQAAASRAGGG